MKHWKYQIIELFSRMQVDTLAKLVQEDKAISLKNSALSNALELQAQAKDYILEVENEDPLLQEAVYIVACNTYNGDDCIDFDTEISMTDDVLDGQRLNGKDEMYLHAIITLDRKEVMKKYLELTEEANKGGPF